jgi:hypothetical protein
VYELAQFVLFPHILHTSITRHLTYYKNFLPLSLVFVDE